MQPKAVRHSILLSLLLTSGPACIAQEAASPLVRATPMEKRLSYDGQIAIAIAQELISLKKYKEALLQADKAIHSDSKSGIPYMAKAYILDQQNEPKKAANAYARAIVLSPNNGYVLNAYASHLCGLKQYQQADINFLKAAEDSNYPLAFQSLENAASCALKVDNYVSAEQRARAALSLNPVSISALETMAQVKFKQSHFFEARAFMQRREALGPLTVSLLQLAHQIEKSAGDDRAAAHYQKQLDVLMQAQTQPPKGEGQNKP